MYTPVAFIVAFAELTLRRDDVVLVADFAQVRFISVCSPLGLNLVQYLS